MHTIKVVSAGMGLLALCGLGGLVLNGRRGVAQGTLVFLPLWLVGTGINMYFGVKDAGYSVTDELPVAAGVFAGPALVAMGLRSQLR